MLNNNKTYDNSNLRDVQKTFNDGKVVFYNASERVLEDVKAEYYYSRESISYESYTMAEQNGKTAVVAIGIPYGGTVIEHGDVAKINGDYYMVDHVQFKDSNRPNWYKVFLERSTVPYYEDV